MLGTSLPSALVVSSQNSTASLLPPTPPISEAQLFLVIPLPLAATSHRDPKNSPYLPHAKGTMITTVGPMLPMLFSPVPTDSISLLKEQASVAEESVWSQKIRISSTSLKCAPTGSITTASQSICQSSSSRGLSSKYSEVPNFVES